MTLLQQSAVTLVALFLPLAAFAKPDLVVRDIRLVDDCKIQVTLANVGTAGVPDTGYHNTQGAAVQMYKGAQPWGGIRLVFVDPTKKLKTAGQSVSTLWFPAAANLKLTPGPHVLSVVVDNNNAIAETNENNNKLTKTVVCGPVSQGKPDLTITDLSLNMQCNVVVHVKNVGTGKIPVTVWTVHTPEPSSVYLHLDGKPWGGLTLWKFDPAKALMMPGGQATYHSVLRVPKSASVRATVDHFQQVAESNEGNNTRVEVLKCDKK